MEITEIMNTIISLIGSLGGTLGGIALSSRLTAYKIEQLGKKVEKHNTVIDRTYALEKHAEIVDEKIKVINHRIEDLER